MIILGIDPGTARMGCAIIKASKNNPKPVLIESQVVTTPSDMDTHVRLLVLHKAILELAKKHSPDILVIEKLFFNTNVTTAISVGQARGVALLVAAQRDMGVFEYTALQAKLVLTGYGRADKKDMQKAVKEHLHLEEIVTSDDANDAVAMALCHVKKELHKDPAPVVVVAKKVKQPKKAK